MSEIDLQVGADSPHVWSLSDSFQVIGEVLGHEASKFIWFLGGAVSYFVFVTGTTGSRRESVIVTADGRR